MSVKIQTFKEIRFYLTKELKGIYEEPEIDSFANIIIKTVFGIKKLHQLFIPEKPVTEWQAERITDICRELKGGKPVQYILEETIFYDCIIKLNSATLIPRPETEELVDLIIKENRDFQGNILDIGTGSGCIAIALAVNLHSAVVTGIDISDEAILIARENATLNNVDVSFEKSDIFNFDFTNTKKAGIIVSNPPYVRNSEKKFINKNVLDFEPHTALFVPDSNPLLYYMTILSLANKILLIHGRVYFEINEAMGKKMVQLLKSSGYTEIDLIKDINGKDRIIKGIKNV
jgi:release factor glutamine methyltransferase